MVTNESITDFLIIGSGIAGLCYALQVAAHGNVVIVTKKHSAESNTNYAQGGIAAVMSGHDSFESHIADTLNCGAGICEPEIVEIVVKEGPQRIRELVSMGARFSQDTHGFHLGKEGGHSNNRIVHTQDTTGREIERALLNQVKKHPNINILEYRYVIDLIISDGKCTGVLALTDATSDMIHIYAKSTLLASGGSGQIYMHTTNPKIATGDGVAMAYRAGAKIANMEFFQFHPTALYNPDHEPFLISEAIRGAGGILVNHAGKRFMPQYHPKAELAPRDVVARAIDEQLKNNGEKFVWLDISNIDQQTLLQQFPNISATCNKYGIDITKQPIPVVPAAHYQCGGVMVDKYARTNIEGLFACGEVAYTGLHGANRLASNSLLEALVFSHHAANTAIEYIKTATICCNSKTANIQPQANKNYIKRYTANKKQSLEQIRLKLRQLMWEQVGIVRCMDRLSSAHKAVTNLAKEIKEYQNDIAPDTNYHELYNMVTVSKIIIESAITRKESRGLHYMQDFPTTNNKFARATIIQKTM